jgi:hypothetical protein
MKLKYKKFDVPYHLLLLEYLEDLMYAHAIKMLNEGKLKIGEEE